MNSTRRIFLILLALLVAVPVGWASDSYAQAGPQQVEGKIKSVDPTGRMVELEDGTKLTIPPALNVPRESLKEGAILKASFEERAGQKVATSVQVQPTK